ncbi:SDR family NAD(P)-dependent oxidoreductase [Klebsiella variicola]|nr:SDR family NAD(P)-dependent oxidoreductase [Klebsiella variicola]
MKNRFTDKKILIIGGSSGIGEATARAFAEAGGHVTIASRNM